MKGVCTGMMRRGTIALRPGKRRREAGAAAVELAVALPLLAIMLVGAIDFSRGFRTAMIVMNAARAGALYGTHSVTNSADTTGMQNAATAVLTANSLPGGGSVVATRMCQCASDAGVFSATSPANTCSASCTGGTHMVVSVTVSATRTFSMVNPFPGLPSSVVITRSSTMRALP